MPRAQPAAEPWPPGPQVLTGDSPLVAKRMCEELGIPAEVCVTGAQLAVLEDNEFEDVVERASIFAKARSTPLLCCAPCNVPAGRPDRLARPPRR